MFVVLKKWVQAFTKPVVVNSVALFTEAATCGHFVHGRRSQNRMELLRKPDRTTYSSLQTVSLLLISFLLATLEKLKCRLYAVNFEKLSFEST